MLRHISLLTMLCACLLTSVPRVNAMGTYDKHITVEEVNSDPTLLSNKYIEKVELKGLHLKNSVITNLTLKDVNAMNGIFENITFERCTFMKARFDDGKFINVSFRNCSLPSLDGTEKYNMITTFNGSTFENVLFDNTQSQYARFEGIRGENGFILFKNIKSLMPDAPAPLISISNAQVRVSDSIINGVIAGDENVHAITKNSQFTKYAGIYGDNTFIINSTLQQSSVGGRNNLIVTDSILRGDANVGGKGYFVRNKYVPGTTKLIDGEIIILGFGLHAEPNAFIYVLAKDNEPTAFRVLGGTVTLRGFTLVNTTFGSLLKEKAPITAINLHNVTIQGGEWEGLRLLGGQWENVKMEPPILVDQTYIKNLRYRQLNFPKGAPWNKKGEFVLEAKESPDPFVWEEVKIPTPEDFGMVWWPEVEPGYHGK